jgi:tetratricopeptide (TPR) repeat protein
LDAVDGVMRACLQAARIFEVAVPGAVVREVCPKPSAQVLGGVRADWLERAVALGLLECYPDGSLRVVRVLPLGLEWDEGSYRRAAEVLYRVWWEEAESSTEAQRLEMHRLALAGKAGDIAAKINQSLAPSWNRKSRFRETVNLCQKTLELIEDYEVLHSLAYAEDELGLVEDCLSHYQRAIDLCPEDEVKGKAALMHNLAVLLVKQGKVEEAIGLYQQSLALKEQIGDVQGKAATLHCMAIIYANQGKVEEAIGLYQQSLALKEQIGDVQGKAATLHCMAIIYANQGKVEEAIGLYQQSLALKEQIGDVQGKAATLHCMAMIYANQGKVEEAIGLYQQSLALKEQIGDVQGKAATLAMMGNLLTNQGEFDRAIPMLQESATILQSIGSWETEKVQQMVINAIIQKVLASPQGPQLQQALEAQDQVAIMELIQAALEAS